VAPAMMWCRLVWTALTRPHDTLLPIREMVALWNTSAPGAADSWQRSTGPVNRVLLSLQRIGWKAESALLWRDEHSNEVHLGKVSPKLMAMKLKSATSRQHEVNAGSWMCLEHRATVEQIRTMLRSSKYSAWEKYIFKVAPCGAIWCRDVLRARGYECTTCCPLCGEAEDSLFHRAWQCQHHSAVDARNQVCPRWLQQWARSEPSNLSWTTGVFAHPQGLPQPCPLGNVVCRDASGEIINISDAHFNQPYIVTDGSAVLHCLSDLSRAGWATLWCDSDFKVVYSVSGPVWATLPQSPQAGEHVGFAAGYELAKAPFVGYSDCYNVVAAANKPAEAQVLPGLSYAGVRRSALANYGALNFRQARYVAAHRTDSEIAALPDQERKVALANREADLAAKAARRECHEPLTEQQRQEVEGLLKRQRLTLLTIARTLAVFPREPRCSRPAKLSKEERAQRRQQRALQRARLKAARADLQERHDWVHDQALRTWRCYTCLATAADDRGRYELLSHGCKPSSPLAAMRHVHC